jgi:hypothetical protein
MPFFKEIGRAIVISAISAVASVVGVAVGNWIVPQEPQEPPEYESKRKNRAKSKKQRKSHRRA